MKKCASMLIVVFFCYAAVAEDGPLELSLKTGYASKYITDFGLFCGNDSWQTEAEINHASGLYLGLFHSEGLGSGPAPDWRDELDMTAGYGREAFGMNFDLSLTYWDCVGVFKDSNADVWYPAFELSRELLISERQSVTPSLRIAFPISVSDEGDDGVHLFVRADHCIQIVEDISIESWASLVRDDGALGLQPGWLTELGTFVNFSVNETISWQNGVRGILLTSDIKEDDIRENDVIFTSSVTLEF